MSQKIFDKNLEGWNWKKRVEENSLMKMMLSVKFQNMCRTDIVDLEIITWLVKFKINNSVIIRIYQR